LYSVHYLYEYLEPFANTLGAYNNIYAFTSKRERTCDISRIN